MSAESLSDVRNFLRIGEQYATSGQPTADQLKAIGEAGFELVINLATPDSQNAIPNEGEIVTQQGMIYVQIPVVWTEPLKSDFECFSSILNANTGRRVFAHCVVNARVSAFTFLYRVIHQGTDPLEAKERMNEIWDPSGVWEAFVDEILRDHGVDYFDID